MKTKDLKIYEINLSDEGCKIISVEDCPLQTRSIFLYPEKYIDHFESLKEFIEYEEKNDSIIVLPENNIKIIAGF